MAYQETKVYFDGSHYIAIPYKANPTVKKSGGVKNTENEEMKTSFEKVYKGTKAQSKKKNLNQT